MNFNKCFEIEMYLASLWLQSSLNFPIFLSYGYNISKIQSLFLVYVIIYYYDANLYIIDRYYYTSPKLISLYHNLHLNININLFIHMYVQIERTLGKNLMKMRDTTADELYSQLSANKMLVCTYT